VRRGAEVKRRLKIVCLTLHPAPKVSKPVITMGIVLTTGSIGIDYQQYGSWGALGGPGFRSHSSS
jgi:hypothetical protein